MLYLSDDSLRVLGEVQPREAQYLPPEQSDVILPIAIADEHLRVAVECLTVDLDGHLLLRKCHVDLVATDWVIRPPPGNACFA